MKMKKKLIRKKKSDSFDSISQDMEESFINQEVEARTNSLRLRMKGVIFLVVLTLLGTFYYMSSNSKSSQSQTTQSQQPSQSQTTQSHYSQEELTAYIEELTKEHTYTNHHWTLDEYASLTIDESGEDGISLENFIKKYGSPYGGQPLEDFANTNRIVLDYVTDNIYDYGSFSFKYVNGKFRLYDKMLTVKNYSSELVTVASRENYKNQWTKEKYDTLEDGTSLSEIYQLFGKPSNVQLLATGDYIYIILTYGKTFDDEENKVELQMTYSEKETSLMRKQETGAMW
ncbi:hypothetical protein [Streptococcus loxodontisalivarius]|uniref:Uncharacterized protein n=1 Tax=Streptococcus loxodontisalivarius TaxID=1349415 RepID=A0ABS2PR29_9STRE|nr:hypothetical protein [Streptococcus loxodontisalivarius]MBM7642336.1 hypothetical protein [Streptococcus loxodontisalivarius]